MRTHGFGDAKVGAAILVDVSRPLRGLGAIGAVTSKVDRQDPVTVRAKELLRPSASNNLALDAQQQRALRYAHHSPSYDPEGKGQLRNVQRQLRAYSPPICT